MILKIEAKVNIVDLAGSERIEKQQVDSNRFKEYQNVNKCLTSLGDVLHALNSKQSHIPYRCSKLTHVLQDSMSYESINNLIIQILPSEQHASETLASLMFSQRLKCAEANLTKIANGKSAKHDVSEVAPRPRRPSTGPVALSSTPVTGKQNERRGSFSSEKANNKLSLTPKKFILTPELNVDSNSHMSTKSKHTGSRR